MASDLSAAYEASASPFHRQVTYRIGFACVALSGLIASVVDLALGTFALACYLLTLGQWDFSYQYAKLHLQGAGHTLSHLHRFAIRTLNPQAAPHRAKERAEEVQWITEKVQAAFRRWAVQCVNSTSLLQKHLLSRCLYVALIPICISTRSLEFLLGLGAAIDSLATLGCNQTYNTYAYRGLQISNILLDTLKCVHRVVRPPHNLPHDL